MEQKDDLLADRVPRANQDGLTVRDLLNRFLTAKQDAVDRGEVAPRTFDDYHRTCKRIADVFGVHRPVADIRTEDFQPAGQAGGQLGTADPGE